MIKVIFWAFLNKCEVHAKAFAIRGSYSHGNQDQPGVWWKDGN